MGLLANKDRSENVLKMIVLLVSNVTMNCLISLPDNPSCTEIQEKHLDISSAAVMGICWRETATFTLSSAIPLGSLRPFLYHPHLPACQVIDNEGSWAKLKGDAPVA